jgi:metal-sulfur cluster biosynthetic enzyme
VTFQVSTFDGELTPEEYDNIVSVLKNVEDPEFNVNIVDLGLVYNISMSDSVLVLTLTLTTPTCPVGDIIENSIKHVLSQHVDSVEIVWVFAPLWSPALITDEGKDMLKALGVNIVEDRAY